VQLPIWENSIENGATIDGDYRYNLWRTIKQRDVELAGTVTFVMLNPSTADAVDDDATIRRCMGYARRWGYRHLMVVNLFAYRSTDPKALRRQEDPVGPKNDDYIEEAVKSSLLVVAAWGNNAVWSGPHSMRNKDVIDIVTRHQALHCLGRTSQYQPKHPLRLRADLEPVKFWDREGRVA